MSNSNHYLILGEAGSGKSTYAKQLQVEKQIDEIFDEVVSAHTIYFLLKKAIENGTSIIICSQTKRSKIPDKLLERFSLIEMHHKKPNYISQI